MQKIEFKYKDNLSKDKWNYQHCFFSNIAECIKLYGLNEPDVEYEITNIEICIGGTVYVPFESFANVEFKKLGYQNAKEALLSGARIKGYEEEQKWLIEKYKEKKI